MNIKKFEIGKNYVEESCYTYAFHTWECIKRTEKTATFKDEHETIRKKILTHTDNNGKTYEYVSLCGSQIRATKNHITEDEADLMMEHYMNG